MEVKKLRIIFTKEDRKTTRKAVENFRNSYIVDAREIIYSLDPIDDAAIIATPQDFIINKELEKKLAQAMVNKKSQQVIYFHYILSAAFIKNIKAFFKLHKVDPTYVIFDPTKEYKKIWRMFDEVIQ